MSYWKLNTEFLVIHMHDYYEFFIAVGELTKVTREMLILPSE